MNTTTSENKIKPGYKKTPIGTIPKDWEVKRIGSISKTFSGGTPRTGVKEYYENGTIPFIKSGEIYQDSTNQKITDLGLKESSAKLIEKGDLLYALYGANSGEVSISKQDGAINQAVLCIKSKMNNKYLEENLTYSHQRIISKYLQGGQGNLSAEILKSVQLPIPPLPEQKAIADCLTTWDKGIEKLTALIQSKKEQKKGLMQGLFNGQLTIKNGQLIQAKEGEDFTEEWKEVRLKDIFKEIVDKNDGSPKHKIMTISSKSGLVLQEDKFNKVIAGSSLSKYIIIKSGDFSYNKGNSKTYPVGCIFQLNEYETAVVPFVYISFSPKDKINSTFYAFWFEGYGLDRQLRKIISSGARGDGLLNVNKKDFFKLKVPFPQMTKQNAIAEVLKIADKEIELLEKKLDQFKTQKKGLMQVLLTGEKRLLVDSL